METVIDWSKAPEWAVAYAQVIYEHETTAKDFAWVCAEGYNVNPFGQTEQICHPYKKDFFAADRFRLIEFRPAKGQPWTGEGLPPVGTVCEYKPYQISSKWSQVEIIAHFRNKAMVAAFIPTGDDGKTVDQAIAECFRPIRTPEQIAAEERQRGIEELGEFLSVNAQVPTPYLWEAAQKIYDAGYRKQVTE